MNSTEGMTLHPTRHSLKQIMEKGFNADDIKSAFHSPDRVYPSGSHPGQFRVTGNGYCLVGKPEGKSFMLITVYLDGVITPPRPDQMNTKAGREYARLYAAGKIGGSRKAQVA